MPIRPTSLRAVRSTVTVAFLLLGIARTGMAQKVVNMTPQTSSNESNQDSEPNLAVNPANPLQMAGTAFTPPPPGSLPNTEPIYFSADGGVTWTLNSVIPVPQSNACQGTCDVTLRFGGTSNILYVGWIDRHSRNVDTHVLRMTPFPMPPSQLSVLQDVNGFAFFSYVTAIDQPYTQATTVQSGPGSGSDRVFIGENDLAKRSANASGTGHTADLDQSLNAATAPPPAGFAWPPTFLEGRTTCGQDGPSIRPALHASGTVYAAFFRWTQCTSVPFTSDVVVVRDDNWGAGATPYGALMDTDGNPGKRVATGVPIPFTDPSQPSTYLGSERIGSSLSLAVDPNNSNGVWISWADGASPDKYTIHVRNSADSGATWGNDVRTVTPATNPALAINAQGVVGFLYQKYVDKGTCARPPADTGTACWETHLETSSVGVLWTDRVLANTPDLPAQFDPSIGDYVHLLAVGETLYGIFSASNFPSKANFPQDVTYQRNVDFTNQRLLDINSSTEVSVSIDPFFFSIIPNPCQGLGDEIQALEQQINELSNLLGDPGFSQATQARIRNIIGGFERILKSEQAQLKLCELRYSRVP
jgi:hypothetical protein